MKFPETLTDKQKSILQQKHKENKEYGNDGLRAYGYVYDMCVETKSKSLLDLSCGKGVLVRQLNRANVVEAAGYDPGIPQYDKIPEETYDIISAQMCLYEYPPEVLPRVFEWMKEHANKGVIISWQFGQPNFGYSDEGKLYGSWHTHDADIVIAQLRSNWPAYTLMDSGRHERLQRKLVFKGYTGGWNKLL